MNILFLDMDGVCNSKQHFLATKHDKRPGADTLVDADLFAMKADTNINNMWVLKYILEKVPDLKIVISSSWRNHYDLESFRELFKIYGLDGSRIIDKTPKKFSSERIHEIHMWLDDVLHPEPELHDCPVDISDGPCGDCDNAKESAIEVDWVAVDDHAIFHLGDPDKDREFLTDSWVGLTMHDAFKVIKHFKPEFDEPEMFI